MRCFTAAVVLAVLVGSAGAQECYTYGSLRGCGDRAPARAASSGVKPSLAAGGTYSSASELGEPPPQRDANAMQFGNTITLPGGQTCATIGTRFVCR